MPRARTVGSRSQRLSRREVPRGACSGNSQLAHRWFVRRDLVPLEPAGADDGTPGVSCSSRLEL